MRGCGFAYPPDDDTPEREALDRYDDFLAAVSSAGIDPRDPRMAERPPRVRYHVRYLVWRLAQPVELVP